MPRGKKGTRVVKAKSKFYDKDVHPGVGYHWREGYSKNGRMVPGRWIKLPGAKKEYLRYRKSVTAAKAEKAIRKANKPPKAAPKKKLSAMYNHAKKPGYNYRWRAGYTTQDKKGKSRAIKGRWVKVYNMGALKRAYMKTKK